MSDIEQIALLTERIEALEGEIASAKKWMNTMYSDMLRLQHATAKAIAGDRDGANAIYVSVQFNSKVLAGTNSDE